jgi:hypothetical protein
LVVDGSPNGSSNESERIREQLGLLVTRVSLSNSQEENEVY